MSESKQENNWNDDSAPKETEKTQDPPVLKSESNPRSNSQDTRQPRDNGYQPREDREHYSSKGTSRYDDRPRGEGSSRGGPRDDGYSRGGPRDDDYPPRSRAYPPREGRYRDYYPPRDDSFSRGGPRNDGYPSRDYGYPPRERFISQDRFDSRDGPRYGDRPPRDFGAPYGGYKRRFDDMAPTDGERPFGRYVKKIREDPIDPNETIGIFNLSFGITQVEFDDFLAEKLPDLKGKFTTKLIFDRITNQCRGFGFVTFDDISDAVKAKQLLEGGEINGQAYRAAYSVRREPINRDYADGNKEL